MKSTFYVFLFIFVLWPLCGMQASRSAVRPVAVPSQAMNLARRIAQQRSKLAHTQHDLVRILSNVRPHKFKREHVEPIVTALAHQNALPLLAANKRVIEQSIRKFINTPGFFPSLQRVFIFAATDLNNFKGSLYELEHALQIAEKNKGEQVTGINQRITCPEKVIKKEFDICTTAGFVECKNINWPSLCAHSHYLRAQFEQQHAIVKLLNAQNEHELYFKISSKERIPNSWCQWFEDQGISYSF